MKQANEELRRARERTPSPTRPGECLSRQELAELVNTHVWEHHQMRVETDANYIGKLERGLIGWPNAQYRQALRHLLAAPSDIALGLTNRRPTVVRLPAPDRAPIPGDGERSTDPGPRTQQHHRQALHTAFAVDDDTALGFGTGTTTSSPPRVLTQVLDPETEDPMKRQTFLTGITAVALGAADGEPLQPWLGLEPSRSVRPSLIGEGDVTAIHRAAEQFRSWSHAQGGAPTVDAVLGQLNWASTLLDQGRFAGDHVRTQMCSAVSYLANVAGFAAYDAGRHAEARRALALAVHAATEVGDHQLSASALTCMARQAITLDQPHHALNLTGLATRGLDTDRGGPAAPAALRSMLHSATARAHARAGDERSALASVAAAEGGYAEPGPDAPDWLQFLPAHVAGDCGNAMFDAALLNADLRDRALSLLKKSAAGHEPHHPRSAALCRVRIAALHFHAGEIRPAVDQTQAFIRLTTGIVSARLCEDRAMLIQHMRPQAVDPDVAALAHRLQESA
jgi:hypothetical protein